MDARLLNDPQDRDEWLRLRRALWPEQSKEEHAAEVVKFLADKAATVFVSPRNGGGLQGFAEVSIRSSSEDGAVPYLEGWYVDPDLRDRRVGRALVEAVERWAKEQGHTALASDTELDNLAGQAAHRALGFEEVERVVVFRKAL